MPTYCATPGCTKAPPIEGCPDEELICTRCTKDTYKHLYDADEGGVPNPYYDPTSDDPLRVMRILRVNMFATRLRNLPLALMMRPCDWPTFKKRVAVVEKKRAELLAYKASQNAAAAAAITETVASSGDAVPYTPQEMKTSFRAYERVLAAADSQKDLLMCNKVSFVGDDILFDESERKLYDPKSCFIVKADGSRALKNDGTFTATRVNSIDDFVEIVERKRGSTVRLPLRYVYTLLGRSTDCDSACALEKMCQDHANNTKVPNHTEGSKYKKGSASKKTPHCGACAGAIIDVLPAVKQGLLFFNSSMNPELQARIITNYRWARDEKYWRKEKSNARQEDLERCRKRNAARSERKKAAKKAAP